jgi:flavodoxin
MRILMILGISVLLVIVMAIGAFAFISNDMGNRATVSETLTPNGTIVGNALVVYDPSITGNTKNVANMIASDLQARGYKVDLEGIKNPKAENTSSYDVIVVGGPIYGGNAGDAVKKYLKTLKPVEGTKIGVFATGDPHTTDEAQIKKQIAPIPENSALQINIVMAISMNDDKTKKCAVFVDDLLK